MSTKYKFRYPEGIYFVSFATVGWVDFLCGGGGLVSRIEIEIDFL